MKTPRYTVHAEQDEIPVRGNALASGDDTADRACEDEIIARLDSGDVWAWAQVEVRAYRGALYASAYLGGCSYENEAAFRADPYFTDLCAEALAELDRRIAEASEEL